MLNPKAIAAPAPKKAAFCSEPNRAGFGAAASSVVWTAAPPAMATVATPIAISPRTMAVARVRLSPAMTEMTAAMAPSVEAIASTTPILPRRRPR